MENVQADSIFTCRVVSNAFPGSESSQEILNLKKYGNLISFEFIPCFCDDMKYNYSNIIKLSIIGRLLIKPTRYIDSCCPDTQTSETRN